MSITRIAVLRDNVVANATAGGIDKPVYAVATAGQPIRYGIGVTILGPSAFKYDPNGCPDLGTRVWVETTSDVIVAGVVESPGSGIPSTCGGC